MTTEPETEAGAAPVTTATTTTPSTVTDDTMVNGDTIPDESTRSKNQPDLVATNDPNDNEEENGDTVSKDATAITTAGLPATSVVAKLDDNSEHTNEKKNSNKTIEEVVIQKNNNNNNTKVVAHYPKGLQNVNEIALEDNANCISIWLLSYLSPLLQLGSTKVLEQSDIGVPPKQDRAERAYSAALHAWQQQSKLCREYNAKMKQQYDKQLEEFTKTEDGNNKNRKKKVKEPIYLEPSIASSLMKSFGRCQLLIGIFYYIVQALLSFVPVLILNDLVKFFQSGVPVKEWDGYAHPWIEVTLLGIIPMIGSLLQTRHQVIMAHCAVFVRTAVSTMLYRKALKVSAAGRAKTSTGQVVNMMSNDTAQLQRFLQFIGMTLVAPIQIIIALYLIYQQVGNATWVGVGYMVFLAPVNTFVFSIVTKQRRKVLKYSDLRVKMMNEILSGIRIIKFYAWEKPFGQEVDRIRSNELEALTKLAYTSAVGFSLILLSAPILQPIFVFVTYIAIQDKPLDSATAFTTVALFNIMRFPFAFMPMGLLQYVQSKIALRRLERYLDLPELAEYVERTAPPNPVNESEKEYGSVTIRNGTFSWIDPDAKPIRDILEDPSKKKKKKEAKERRDSLKSSQHSNGGGENIGTSSHSYRSSVNSEASSARVPTITLQELNCHIPAGSLVAVVGPVGSGKSSFLSALLGEMEPINDSRVYIPRPNDADNDVGFISYCAQTPWVVNDTLRGNVLFGREYDEERYEQVLAASALVDDLAILPAGDLTEIGERGINLSGGQKARVSLARSLYSRNTKLILMDDPLSAVDAHVGEHIFSNAINGEVSNGITRILVTHHVHLLSRCDSVIVLEHGRIQHHGPYHELVNNGVDFAGAIDVSKVQSAVKSDEEGEKDLSNETEAAVEKALENAGTNRGTGTVKAHTKIQEEAAGNISDKAKAKLKQSGKKLTSEEEREEGSVSGSAYLHYARAGGIWLVGLTIFVQAIGRGFEIMGAFWLAKWTGASWEAESLGNVLPSKETNFYVGIYALFGILGVFGLTARAIIIAVHRLNASQQLHNDIAARILRAPVAFFDVTPIGRILNRFSADMDKIDLELTQSLSQGLSTLFSILGALGAIIAATKGTFLVPLMPMFYMYNKIQRWFRQTSTELQRINSIANSPIFADFSMTLSGTSTIRAYSKEKMFFDHCKSSFDTMNASYILVQLVSYWLGLRLDVLGGSISAFVAGVAVGTASSGLIPAGWLALALTFSIEVTTYLKHGVRMIATIEAQMNSVERVLYYTNNVQTEAPDFTDKDPKEDAWPTGGAIEFKNASMRYRDGPLVLKDISFKINPGEKIGVCGRTGSGKSSLMVALFRISELEQDGGAILIDGINTADMGTSALRLNLSIIPQDPVVFSNTVRYNLDPFGKATDEELWDVLKKVQMDEVIAALPAGLSDEVSEGGENFSQGQRQLLCIARSLLRKPKILIMDEATASIDNATDNDVQEMIRENFKNATVLTIAHRLNTIMDSDRVLVLDDGRIAEFASPEKLLATEDSLFKAMTDKSRAAKELGNLQQTQ